MDSKSGGDVAVSDFPYAPEHWTPAEAELAAQADGIVPGETHWEAMRALQEYFARHGDAPSIKSRDLHDALEEHFHSQGGMKYLYTLFPGGPVTQGCRLAGLQAPAGSIDKGFGSVQ
jgi:TusE/DsrC/DsvC family sulfur relay protein